jgi:cytochrome P450
MLDFDLTDPATRADPFPVLKALREAAPVHWSPAMGGWVLTRYEDVRRAATDPAFSSDRVRPFFRAMPVEQRERFPALETFVAGWAVFQDPPYHTRLRRLMNKAFTPRAVARLEPQIGAIVDRLLDRAAAKGEIDAIADFAYPLPASVVMLMLGVPLDDLDPVKRWSDDMALFVGTAKATPDKYATAERGMREMAGYFRPIVEDRRRNPRDDLTSALVAPDENGDRLSDDEAIAGCSLLLFAGHETTANLIGNGLLALGLFPGEAERVRRDPALTESCVEEMLRWDGPSGGLVRVVGEEVELGGKLLRKGERVFAMMHGANRDPAEFPDPDRFDAARAPNRHLTFAAGIHFCLGAPLARLEARIAVEGLLARFPRFEVETRGLDWIDSLILRGVKSLPLRLQ